MPWWFTPFTCICLLFRALFSLLSLQSTICVQGRRVVPSVMAEGERHAKFYPEGVLHEKHKVEWVTYQGRTIDPLTQYPTAEVIAVTDPPPFSLGSLPFRDPNSFVSGGLSGECSEWEKILVDNPKGQVIYQWVRHGVSVSQFFRHFKGNYRGMHYDCDSPPSIMMMNASLCDKYTDFISNTLLDRIRNGSISVLGRVGDVPPPGVVLPLTVETSKPRLCMDARYVNLWTRDSPFSLETLKDVPRMVNTGDYMCTCDEKSGYDHVMITPDSRKYFGCSWGGWYLHFNTICFGWKASPYIYQTIGLAATGYIRKLQVFSIQYIDDRLISVFSGGRDSSCLAYKHALQAIYIVCHILCRLGYTLSLGKSVMEPSQIVLFLGMFVDSQKGAFIIPQEKIDKFASLRERILQGTKSIDITTLQRLQGKCMSFALAVPGARLYISQMALAIGKAGKTSGNVALTGSRVTSNILCSV